jgi:hypothetical protein
MDMETGNAAGRILLSPFFANDTISSNVCNVYSQLEFQSNSYLCDVGDGGISLHPVQGILGIHNSFNTKE